MINIEKTILTLSLEVDSDTIDREWFYQKLKELEDV